jgi:hypothetical protein
MRLALNFTQLLSTHGSFPLPKLLVLPLEGNGLGLNVKNAAEARRLGHSFQGVP